MSSPSCYGGVGFCNRVVGKRMVKDGVVVDNIGEGSYIQNKDNRSKNRSLWDSAADGHCDRAIVFDSYSLSSV